MVSASTIAAIVITLVICFLFPVLLWVLLGRGVKGFYKMVLLGNLGFIIPQLCIRIPLIQILSAQDWWYPLVSSHTIFYYLILALTAGLFETAGRCFVFRNTPRSMQPMTMNHAAAAGIGHGGIEAITLVGVTYINNLIIVLMLNSMGSAPAGQMQVFAEVFAATPTTDFLLAGYERVCTMLFHIALSLLLAAFWISGKKAMGFLACTGVHALVDFVVPLALLYSGRVLSYSLLTVAAILSCVYMFRCLKKPARQVIPPGTFGGD